jgi:exonuclease SbcC
MHITQIIAKNFQLFEYINLSFQEKDLVTLIRGINKDVTNAAGNGAGKSTILNAILFGLYGNVTGYTLTELLRLNSTKATVEIQFTYENDKYTVTRIIPSSLEIIKNDEKLQFNTATIAQNYLNTLIGDTKHFLTYRMIDKNKGINLLDLGVVSLRKSLMDFVNNQFIESRNRLLAQKLEREKFSKKHRPYTYFLSEKRQNALLNGLNLIKETILNAKQESSEQNKKIHSYHLKIGSIQQNTQINEEQINSIEQQSVHGQQQILIINNEIKEMEQIKPFNTSFQYNVEIEQVNKEINSNNEKIDSLTSLIKETEKKISVLQTTLKEKNNKIKNTEREIVDLKTLQSGSRCDKCGSEITEKNRDQFISDKDFELSTLNEDAYSFTVEIEANADLLEEFDNELKEYKQNNILNNQKIEELRTKEKEYDKQKNIIEKQQILINSKKDKIKDYETQLAEGEILKRDKIISNENLQKELKTFSDQIINEIDLLNSYNDSLTLLEIKEKKAESFLMKLQESFKFQEYKYDESDVELYNKSVKCLDDFSAYYISEYLDNLEIILNDLLKEINISIEFNMDKSFLKVKDNGQELSYNQLSSGQRTFLNTIFKIGILLNEGIMDGLLLIDEGLGDLDIINFKKLVSILKTLTFQSILIYQNVETNIPEIRYIVFERENGASTVK